ncbi:hypothetical protein OG585_02225 [Streptomyces sp. NBC_01340]|nr:hypothetical protein OG585_02225 [Streptomyces sp. NBC_01340]
MAPTPLWPMYRAHDGFSATTTTVAFAMLVVGAAAGFLALGHLSDRLGRRRIVVPACWSRSSRRSSSRCGPSCPAC